MKEPHDAVDDIEWADVPLARSVELVKASLEAQRARGVFHLAAYVWLVTSLFTIMILEADDMGWAAVATAVTGLALCWLGSYARGLDRRQARMMRSLADDHPSRG